MRFTYVFLMLGLAACDAAGPGFRGVDKTVREVEGSRFTLRRQGDVVEAIRTNPEMMPRFQPVARKAGIAAQLETGCIAKWVVGDPSMMTIGLSCDGRKAPRKPRKSRVFYCDLYGITARGGALECQKG
ncbi:hypothetical protein [Tropicibacter naphthalenivorans]|uniref:Lipoprotein n=1 Tax=Tropicibacter naphthalenivorans TaxID=441103 RepID=A0A0N7LYH1_9RHOB|nr:hypothetical protein [Tropicibacter naphthalenivorans]CUH74849.1 hypothetical protein TRN7648_00116 [Tropicibacter naphthalenivorans]SMC48663.1 hypothetical protein SAMN04488093_101762 [Tropicibacter naphthalenivorans]